MRSNRSIHRKIVIGAEVESYTIVTPGYYVSRQWAFPRKGVGEKGERFVKDWSIGTEYNSRPFQSVREGLFLLKAGLRKYSHRYYRSKNKSTQSLQLLLTGGWSNRFAGSHLHMSVNGEKLSKERAKSLARHLHDHIPLLIAICANSPVWNYKISNIASNRITRASHIYFHAIKRNSLSSRSTDEMLFSPGRKTKPPTLEIRVFDSNIPEFIMAAACIVKAAALGWLKGKKAPNKLTHTQYVRSRRAAAVRGMRAELCWGGRWMKPAQYLDRFIWSYRHEIRSMDIPGEIWTTFKLLRQGTNGSDILLQAARDAYQQHPQTWQNRFSKRYDAALDSLLSGNSILDFASHLNIKLPNLSHVWLGRKGLRLS